MIRNNGQYCYASFIQAQAALSGGASALGAAQLDSICSPCFNIVIKAISESMFGQ